MSLIIILFIVMLVIFSILWGNRTFSVKTLNQMFYHMIVPCDGTDDGIFKDWFINCFPPAFITTVIGSVLLYKTPFVFLFDYQDICITVLILGTLFYALINYQIITYVFDMVRTSKLYEEHYVDPKNVELDFKEKRNLIHIYLESVENTYLSKEDGGQEENNYIKELGELANENINFSHTDKIGGSYTIEGTQWTIASMVGQEAGIPLLFPLSKDKYNENSSFLSGCYTLGEILEKQGYQNRILMGSDANFGCTSNFYKQHGNFKIEDTTSLKKEGRLPQDYHVFWGFEDKKVFEFAKEDLTEMAKSNQPFCMELVTIDTHTPDGYICDKCKHEYDSQYANVISCQSRQVEAFVRWCQKQEWYENTTIVITGDHKSMSEKFFKHLDKNYLRTPYNCFINSAIEPLQPKNRKFAIFDFYPTILASLGVKIKGEHLGLGTNLFSDEKTLLEKYGVKKINSEVTKYSQFYRKILINKQKNV